MNQGNIPNFLKYFTFLGAVFFLLYSLDNFLGLHYQPSEHRLNAEPIDYDKNDLVEYEIPTSTKELHAESESESVNSDHSSSNMDHETSAKTENKISTDQYFKNLIADYKADVLSNLPPNKARTDIVIRYYRHPRDGNGAYALDKLGYYIHERPVNPKYEKFQSNAIYYGDSVKLKDLMIVGYSLLKEGVPIKVIKPSKFGDSWKSRSIEIGTDTTLLKLPNLTLEELQNFKR